MPSFDAVSKIDDHELTNALDGTPYERFLHDEAYEAPGS